MLRRHLLPVTLLLLVTATACGSEAPTADAPSETAASNRPAQVDGTPDGTTNEATAGNTAAGTPGEAPATGGAPDAIRDAAFADLETLRKDGERILTEDPDLTDGALRDAVMRDADVPSAVAAEGANGIKVTFTRDGSSCSGIIVFEGGTGTWNGIGCS